MLSSQKMMGTESLESTGIMLRVVLESLWFIGTE
jgi:hypothetical protein